MDASSIFDIEALLDRVDIAAEKTELCALVRVVGRLNAKLALVVAECDRAQTYADDHAVSMAQWLCHHTGLDRKSANGLVRTGRQLTELPVTANAAVSGALRGGQLRAVLANLSNTTRPLFATHEADLIPTLVPLSVRETALAMNQWRAKAEALLDGPEPTERVQRLSHAQTLGGRWHTSGSFDTEPGSVIQRALSLYRSSIPAGDGRGIAEQNAEAFEAICRFFLDHQHDHLGGRHRPHVNVVIDLADMEGRGQARLLDDTPVSAAATRRLLCDSAIHRVITKGRSTILDFGTATRTIPAALYTALVLRDRHCRFPGCDRPPEWCEGHHIIPWEHGGPTVMTNLGLFCSRDHHRIHAEGWTVELRPDGTMHFTDATGRTFTTTLDTIPAFAG